MASPNSELDKRLNPKGLSLGVCVVVGQEAEALRAPPDLAQERGV